MSTDATEKQEDTTNEVETEVKKEAEGQPDATKKTEEEAGNAQEVVSEKVVEVSESETQVAKEADDVERLPLLFSLKGFPFDRRFSEMPLRSEIILALVEKGYRSATRIQQAIIENCMSGNDWWLSANLSSNRSIALGACFSERALLDLDKTSVLIVSSVPEVRRNFGNDLQEIVMFTDLKILYLKNTLDKTHTIELSEKPNIVIASADDILLLSEQGQLDLKEVSVCFLDEAEKLFRIERKEAVNEILTQCSEAQLLVQSSYFKHELRKDIGAFRPNLLPVRFSKRAEEVVPKKLLISEIPSVEKLCCLLLEDTYKNSLVLASSKEEVEQIGLGLSQFGFTTEILCKESHFKQKERVLKNIAENSVQILIATADSYLELAAANVGQIILTSEMVEEEYTTLMETFSAQCSQVFVFTASIAEDNETPIHTLLSTDEASLLQKKRVEDILLQNGLRSGFQSYLAIVEDLSESAMGKELLAVALAEVIQNSREKKPQILEKMLRLEKKDIFFSNRRKHHRGRKPQRKKR